MSTIYELKTLSVDDIFVDSRIRQDYGDMEQVKESLIKYGQIQPICVSLVEEEGSPYPYRLIAGGRRLLAMKELGWKVIDCKVITSTLSEEDRRVLELEENVRRLDLTPQEQLLALGSYHEARVGQVGTGHSMRDTAKELGGSISSISQDLALAQALKNPRINKATKKAKSKSEIFRTVAALKEEILLEELRKRKERRGIPEDSLASFYHTADSLTFVRNLDSESVDFIEADPDYGIGITASKKLDAASGVNVDDYVEFEVGDSYLETMAPYITEWYRVLRPDRWLILWYAFQYHSRLIELCKSAGFIVSQVPALWVKESFQGQNRHPNNSLSSIVEPFLYMRKGNASLCKAGRTNIYTYPTVNPSKKIHITEKPINLLRDVISTFIQSGIVFVPFLGSGVTLKACRDMTEDKLLPHNLKAFGCDISAPHRDRFIASLELEVINADDSKTTRK